MLIYLSSSDVRRFSPDVESQLALASSALGALASRRAEMPSKVAVHPRDGALLEAMPAWWHTGDIAGVKWISAFPGNRSFGLPQVMGVIILNEAATGAPVCILDAAEITLSRTAAISALAIRLYADGPNAVALLGAGAQGLAHVKTAVELGLVNELRVFDHHVDRADHLLTWVHAAAPAVPAHAYASAQETVEGASVILSCASLGTRRQVLRSDWVDAARLIVAIDEDVYLSSDIVRSRDAFIVDDIQQFRSALDQGGFAGFPDPVGTLGGSQASGALAPAHRDRVAVVTLGVGIADIIFASAVYRNALESGSGLALEP